MKAGGAVKGVVLPAAQAALGAGREVIVCCQSNAIKPQKKAASRRVIGLSPHLPWGFCGVKVAVIVVTVAECVTELLSTSGQLQARVSA